MQIQNLILFISFVGSNNPNWLTSEDITKNNLCFETMTWQLSGLIQTSPVQTTMKTFEQE